MGTLPHLVATVQPETPTALSKGSDLRRRRV
jgi:hypothetical protein